MEKFKVTFYPDNKTIEVDKGKTILSAAISAGVFITSACGGDGVCGRCKVIVKKGKVFSQPTGMLSAQEKKQSYYLACLSVIEGDIEVEVPAQSRQDFEKLSITENEQKFASLYEVSEEIESAGTFTGGKPIKHSPLVTKIYIELPQPDLNDRISDLERLNREIKKIRNVPIIHTGICNIRQLGELLRDADWKVTVTVGKRDEGAEIVCVEPQDTSSKNFGICLDIGTTTIACQLVDLNNDAIIGTKATYNKQVSFGSDVITRIIYAKEEDGLEKLHTAVTEGINQMIQELTQEHNIDLNDVNCAVCAGNPTMIHLLLRIDPAYIRKEPYVPTANYLPVMHAFDAGIKINPRGLLYCIPSVASYVGADVTAGVLACGMDKEKEPCLLIDIGTNGEIVLGNSEFLVSASASAGPAFEGSGVTSGMRASKGAIQKVTIDRRDYSVSYSTIGNAPPRGICGSGYIDLIAQLLTCGILDKGGKIKDINSKRIRKNDTCAEFVVAFKEEADTGSDIVITEADIENIKRAKGAIYSAASSLLKHMGLNFGGLNKIFIAGGFGTSIEIKSAVKIGLLPDIAEAKFIFLGNSSLTGARIVLLSSQAMKKAEDIARKMTCFELSVEPEYMDEYMAALFFPHTDAQRFPSVKI